MIGDKKLKAKIKEHEAVIGRLRSDIKFKDESIRIYISDTRFHRESMSSCYREIGELKNTISLKDLKIEELTNKIIELINTNSNLALRLEPSCSVNSKMG